MGETLLILDNNCLKWLEPEEQYDRFVSNVRAAGLSPQPTLVNLLEATATPSSGIRERLFQVIRKLGGEHGLLPWPFTLLQEIGRALLRGESKLYPDFSGAEWYLTDPEAATRLSPEVLTFQQGIETAFTKLHDGIRRKVRRQVKEGTLINDFEDARDFLERYWTGSESWAVFADLTWTALGLPEPAPRDALLRVPAWSILLDAEGVATYERAIAKAQPKKAQRLDLVQLVYLAGARKRILATEDEALLRVGNVVLASRYENARVVHIRTLVA
jgi:hypothetical protein